MNHKIIAGIVCLLIVVCLAVGIGMNSKSGNSEHETNLISDKETVSTLAGSSAQNNKAETNGEKEENEPTASVKNEVKTSVRSSGKKENEPQASVKNVSSTKKAETSSGKPENEAKPPVKSSTTKKQTTTVKTTESNNLSVSFSVNCEKAVDYSADYPKYIIGKTKCKVEKGTTVFDLLCAECSKNGVAVVHQNKSYIKAIGGLSEKDCGNASGWIYKVNGVKPMMAASKYVLKDGDVVEWYYVTSPTD